MLERYLDAAMERAVFEVLPDDGTYFGRVPELRGAWANEPTLDACRGELREAVRDWVLFRFSRGLTVPSVGGI